MTIKKHSQTTREEPMPPQNTTQREDIENRMQHGGAPVRESNSEQALDSAFDANLEHDLLVWPRQLLEMYLKRHQGGHIPLNDAQLPEALELAYETSEELLHSAIEPALTDSGAYLGTIIWEGQEVLLQHISPNHAIVHSKALLKEIPHTGEFVGITYRDGSASVSEVAPRTTSRDVGR